MAKHNICIARGDGIGPEIMQATLDVLNELKLDIEFHEIELGEKLYLKGHSAGIETSSWDLLRQYPVLLKAPITTPQGKGYKSLNVTLRKTLGLFANVRRSLSYDPIVPSRFKNLDVVIFRENEEDLYAGIEHRQTQEVYQCLKLTSRPGCEKIIRAAFEYAKAQGRKKVTCMSKDNIMKLTDGIFHKVFDEIREEFPEIESDHYIIDIGAARLATNPEHFDVVVCQNLYGDIISDITAEISGSVGLAGSSNLGERYAMFEAIHGSAPDIAGKNIANPVGIMLAAVEMLHFIGESEKANEFHKGILYSLENGSMTGDLCKDGASKALSTSEFAKVVIGNLGKEPKILNHISKSQNALNLSFNLTDKKQKKELVGVDVFVDEENRNPVYLSERLMKAAEGLELELTMITNRGVMVWPNYNPATFCTDHWRCRFEPKSKTPIGHVEIVKLLERLETAKIDFIKTEGLFMFDGERGYSLGQGQ
jgi:isocitrate dehydrogenase